MTDYLHKIRPPAPQEGCIAQYVSISQRVRSQFISKMVYYTNCFCCKSKTGAQFLAILGILYNSLYIIFIGSIFYGVNYDKLHRCRMRKKLGPFAPYINAILEVFIVIILAWISCCALLLHGINKKKKDLLKPWLIFDMIRLVVSKMPLHSVSKSHKMSHLNF